MSRLPWTTLSVLLLLCLAACRNDDSSARRLRAAKVLVEYELWDEAWHVLSMAESTREVRELRDLVARMRVSAEPDVSPERPAAWDGVELLRTMPLFASAPYAARLSDGRNGCRLECDERPNLPSGFCLPVGPLGDEFRVRFSFTAPKPVYDTTSALYFGTGCAPGVVARGVLPSNSQDGFKGFVVGVGMSGGGDARRGVGGFVHGIQVHWNEHELWESSAVNVDWQPGRPYEVELAFSRASREVSVVVSDAVKDTRYGGRAVLAPAEMPKPQASWAFGMASPGEKHRNTRIFIDDLVLSGEVRREALKDPPLPPGWKVGTELARGRLSEARGREILAEHSDAQTAGVVAWAHFRDRNFDAGIRAAAHLLHRFLVDPKKQWPECFDWLDLLAVASEPLAGPVEIEEHRRFARSARGLKTALQELHAKYDARAKTAGAIERRSAVTVRNMLQGAMDSLDYVARLVAREPLSVDAR